MVRVRSPNFIHAIGNVSIYGVVEDSQTGVPSLQTSSTSARKTASCSRSMPPIRTATQVGGVTGGTQPLAGSVYSDPSWRDGDIPMSGVPGQVCYQKTQVVGREVVSSPMRWWRLMSRRVGRVLQDRLR